MPLGLGCPFDLCRRTNWMMPVVVAAQHLSVEFEPGLDSMAGRANGNHGTAGCGVLLEMFQLIAFQLHSLDEDEGHLALVELFKTWQIIGCLTNDAGAVEVVILF